jgi:hypothetical protein
VVCSFFTWSLFGLFLVLKLQVMAYGINPVVSTIKSIDVHNSHETAIDLEKNQFTIAFGVKGYLSGEIKHDPKYV